MIEILYKAIREYYPDAKMTSIDLAYQFALDKHKNQTRKSGDPYHVHPLKVALTLAKLKMDIPSITASLLHDVVEDTDVKIEEISGLFGDEVAHLVDGVTKLSKFNFKSSEEAQADNFRKMIIAMAKDIRVIMIKLADRLHNMQTLSHLNEEKQLRIAQETIDIYAPIANRLGISWLKVELEDLALLYTNPDLFNTLQNKIKMKENEQGKYINEVIEIIQDRLADYQIKGRVYGRLKNYYSIAKKMEIRNLEFEQIFDIIAFRIIVDDVSQCYEVLGIIHSFWKPVPGRFKDYIAMPKPNNYQSLHTTVIGPYGERVEIQIRTDEMHSIAEYGIAAHWLYKEGHMADDDTNKFTWLRSLLETQQEISDPTEFLDSVKLELFSGEVFVFTPGGEVKEFPVGSTPIDFAYSIHTDIGNTCIGARVDDRIVPLKYNLKSGDTIEILTSANQKPHKDWLNHAKTSKARNKIRQYLKTVEKEHSKQLGKEMLEKEFKKHGLSYQSILKDGKMGDVVLHFKYKNIEELLTTVGYGKVTPKEILKIISPEDEKAAKPSILEEIIQRAAKTVRHGKTAVKISGVEDILVRYAKCCTPVHGEPIIGFITRGRGITIHRKDCQKVLEIDSERLIEVDWDLKTPSERIVRIRVDAMDIHGLLVKMTKVFAENNSGVVAANIKTTKYNQALSFFEITVKDLEHINRILRNLRKIEGVISASRVSMQQSGKD